MSSANKHSRPTRLIFVDCIRIFCALIIFIYHFCAFGVPAPPAWPLQIYPGIDWGQLAVSMFIVLSGFTLVYTGKNQLDTKTFYHQRLWRLYLPYWLWCSALFCIHIATGWANQPLRLASTLWTFSGLDTIVTPFLPIPSYYFTDWYFGFMIILTLLTPIIWRAFHHHKFFCGFVLWLLAAGSFLWLPWHNIKMWPLARLFEFYLGLVLGHWWQTQPSGCARLRTGLLALGFFTILLPLKGPQAYLGWLRTICLIPGLFTLASLLEAKLQKLPGQKLLIALSADSYAFFLCHHLIQHFWVKACTGAHSCPLPHYLAFSLLLVICLITAHTLTQASNWLTSQIRKLPLDKINIM